MQRSQRKRQLCGAAFLFAVAPLLIASPARAQITPQEQSRGAATSTAELQKKLDAIAAAHHGHVALYAKNLTTGDTVAIDAQTPVQTASVIKMALMLQAFEQVKAGKLKLSQPCSPKKIKWAAPASST